MPASSGAAGCPSTLRVDGYGLTGAALAIRPVDGVDPWLELVRLEGAIQTVQVIEGPASAEVWADAVADGR